MIRIAIQAVRALIVFTVITGIAYPLIVTGIAQVAFKDQANGSLIEKDGTILGSRLIGQQFSDPGYFWGRPSATSPMPYNGASSSGSNLGPTNPALRNAVLERVTGWGSRPVRPVPADLVTASASGLDPHISPAAARYQLARIAKARGIAQDRLRGLVEQHTEGRSLGLLGEARVNVLTLNLELAGFEVGSMAATRPDPDALLARVQRDEAKARRGKLKIFFGATAGVGKTYAMLEEARTLRAKGADVVVGYVEPHGRVETEALLEGLEQLPYLRIDYRGRQVREFDLDAALSRKPGVLLVDELAHSNPTEGEPRPRHAKRWQDIEEVLAAGVDVFTTVNVQHLESLNDVVTGITGVRMQETVPDSVFENADEVELLDTPPDELLERLRGGKVYVPEQVAPRRRQLLPQGKPDRASRAGAAHHSGPRRPGDARVSRGRSNPGHLGCGRAHHGRRRSRRAG